MSGYCWLFGTYDAAKLRNNVVNEQVLCPSLCLQRMFEELFRGGGRQKDFFDYHYKFLALDS